VTASYPIALGDVDQDGRVDVVTASAWDAVLGVLLNRTPRAAPDQR
jgi:hypothetical protein